MTAAKPHLRLRYLADGVWFADVYARRADAIPLMFTRFVPNVPAALREAAGSEEDALFAIEQARTDRKYLGRRHEPKRPPPQLRIVRGGQPLDFPPDGGGEAA